MKWLNSWASGVIVAIIVATLLEILLPEGNNKKYIKIIIALYILFTILAPVVSKVSNINLENFIQNANKYEYYENKGDINTDEIIKNTYINSIKEDVEKKLLNKGYKTNKIIIDTEKSEEKYLNIKKLELNISKEKDKSKIEKIKEVNINISRKNIDQKEKLSEEEITKIKKYLAESYEISEDSIIVM